MSLTRKASCKRWRGTQRSVAACSNGVARIPSLCGLTSHSTDGVTKCRMWQRRLTVKVSARAQARAMCASWPYQISSECVAELIASDIGDPDYLVSLTSHPSAFGAVHICTLQLLS